MKFVEIDLANPRESTKAFITAFVPDIAAVFAERKITLTDKLFKNILSRCNDLMADSAARHSKKGEKVLFIRAELEIIGKSPKRKIKLIFILLDADKNRLPPFEGDCSVIIFPADEEDFKDAGRRIGISCLGDSSDIFFN